MEHYLLFNKKDGLFHITLAEKKTYIITDLGKQIAQNELKRIKELTQIANEVIGGINE